MHDADLSARDIDQETPLHWAVANEQVEAVEYLLKQKVAVTLLDKYQKTALDLASLQCSRWPGTAARRTRSRRQIFDQPALPNPTWIGRG